MMENKMTAKQALEKLVSYILIDKEMGYMDTKEENLVKKDKEIIEQALIDYEKQKQILEVLKNKGVDIFLVGITDCVEEYNELLGGNRKKYALTETEFNLIKEWLK